MKIGKKIKKYRKLRNITISELAEKAGLSVGMISQIERDKIGLSVSSLWKIAQALNVSIGDFFEEETPGDKYVVRKDNRKKIKVTNSTAIYELLTPDLSWNIEFLKITIMPGESSDDKKISHKGEETGYIIQGTLLIKWGEKEFILKEGDSIRLDSTIPHRYINIGDEKSISIWAMTPPSF
ncbi:MAG TPA: helix-turn-helix domain-containing protein [Halanaerobiales bacterium]|nr:helix-turn-helix domain-containing protein [Halanaerobiales bacterium]